MNYGYSQQFGGRFGRYDTQQPYRAPSMPQPQQGTPALGRYAQGLDKAYGEVQFMRDQGFSDDEIRKAGLDPEMGRGMLGSYGGLLNQRDALKQDMISGIESGAKWTGNQIASGAEWTGSQIASGAKWLGGAL